MDIGSRLWAIAEGHIPGAGIPDNRALESHEAACILNAGDHSAQIELMLFFRDREPLGPYFFSVPARRCLHLRFNDLSDPQPIPRDTDYASLFTSDRPVVIQHTRLDSRDPRVALLSTMAFPQPVGAG